MALTERRDTLDTGSRAGPGAHQMEEKELIKDGLIMMSSLINSFLYTALTFLEGNASCVEKAIALTLTASVEDTFNP